MKIRNLGIVCLAALLVVYLGVTLFTSVYTAVNTRESTLLDPMLFSENLGIKQSFVPLGDPIVDPRPH